MNISHRSIVCAFTFFSSRFTFQIAFWDALKTLDDGAARRAGSLARLMAHLVIRKQLSLTVLKVRGPTNKGVKTCWSPLSPNPRLQP